MKNGLADGVFMREKGRKRTAMDGEAVGSETGFQDLVSGSELHQMLTMTLDRVLDRT